MNALTAFSHREEQLLAALRQAKDVEQAIAACAMALEQTRQMACPRVEICREWEEPMPWRILRIWRRLFCDRPLPILETNAGGSF